MDRKGAWVSQSSGSEDEELDRITFFQITSFGALREVFGRAVRVRLTGALEIPEQPKQRNKLHGNVQPQDLVEIEAVYRSLFDRGDCLERVKLPSTLPAFLLPLFRHMAFCRNRTPPEPLFHNGAGKLWVAKVKEMRHLVDIGSDWGDIYSTTSGTSDWCHMRADNITGI